MGTGQVYACIYMYAYVGIVFLCVCLCICVFAYACVYACMYTKCVNEPDRHICVIYIYACVILYICSIRI